LFISLIFPIADFRSLHKNNAGRLQKPRWGESDPQAEFAKGFGSIHTRTKSGIGFIGENYYADCNNLIRYPDQFFIEPLFGISRKTLVYPIYRRFYFDGQMSGRFEFGFRLNEGSIHDIDIKFKGESVSYDAVSIANQMLSGRVQVNMLDGRRDILDFNEIGISLRDSFITSSTSSEASKQNDIQTVGSVFVGVGKPFVFIRAGNETPLHQVSQKRDLTNVEVNSFLTHSGKNGRVLDLAVIQSTSPLDEETAAEHFVRLFYTQMRTLCFAHSFYLRQTDNGKMSGPSNLAPAIQGMLGRLQALEPIEDDPRDSKICAAMAGIIQNSDVNPQKLAEEVTLRLKQSKIRKAIGKVIPWFDQKIDIAIGAAAESATKLALTGSP